MVPETSILGGSAGENEYSMMDEKISQNWAGFVTVSPGMEKNSGLRMSFSLFHRTKPNLNTDDPEHKELTDKV